MQNIKMYFHVHIYITKFPTGMSSIRLLWNLWIIHSVCRYYCLYFLLNGEACLYLHFYKTPKAYLLIQFTVASSNILFLFTYHDTGADYRLIKKYFPVDPFKVQIWSVAHQVQHCTCAMQSAQVLWNMSW